MISEEGQANVSAHRGYLDIVVTDFDIQGLGAPPVFEAEWVQDGARTHDYDTFTTYSSGGISFSALVPVWDQSKAYGLDWNVGICLYSIPATRQYFDFDAAPDFFNYYGLFRYSRSLDRLFYLGSFSGIGGWNPIVLDGSTGAVVSSSGDEATTGSMGDDCLVDATGGAFVVGFSNNQQIFTYVIGTDDNVTLGYRSSTAWQGYADIECVTPGAVRGGEADFWFCADSDLVKVTLTSLGTVKSTTVLATIADGLRYAIYDDDGDLVVMPGQSPASMARLAPSNTPKASRIRSRPTAWAI